MTVVDLHLYRMLQVYCSGRARIKEIDRADLNRWTKVPTASSFIFEEVEKFETMLAGTESRKGTPAFALRREA